MAELPHLDDHVQVVDAPPERVWPALTAVLVKAFRPLPRPLASLWKLEQPAQVGDWTDPGAGDAIPGFAVLEADPPQRLVLRGRHRFSSYELEFTVTADGGTGSALRARSSAEFPGVLGFGYRTLVVTSRLHVLTVRRLLGQVARRAERG